MEGSLPSATFQSVKWTATLSPGRISGSAATTSKLPAGTLVVPISATFTGDLSSCSYDWNLEIYTGGSVLASIGTGPEDVTTPMSIPVSPVPSALATPAGLTAGGDCWNSEYDNAPWPPGVKVSITVELLPPPASTRPIS